MDVYGLGTLAVDVLMKVDHLPGKDSFCVVEESVRQPGGSGTNAIVQAARLGASCGYIGAVGDDGLGKDVLESLQKENVDTGSMVIKPGKTTLHTDIVIDRSGDKFIMLNMGDAFLELCCEETDLDAVAGAKVFYTDLLPYAPALEALKTARANGVKTVFNLQVGLDTMEGMGISREDILNALPYADVFAPCRDGLYALTDTQDMDRCAEILRKYCDGLLIFTKGKEGSVAYGRDGRCYKADTYPVKAVDTTGAGDSYIGSFLVARYLKGWDVQKSMEFASVCAGYTCSGIGARFSPDYDTAWKIFTERK